MTYDVSEIDCQKKMARRSGSSSFDPHEQVSLILMVHAATQAADLVALNGFTSLVIDASAISSVSGLFSDVNNVYVTNISQYSGLGDEAVTLTDTSVSASDANAIAGATSGVLTATVTADAGVPTTVTWRSSNAAVATVSGTGAADRELLLLNPVIRWDGQLLGAGSATVDAPRTAALRWFACCVYAAAFTSMHARRRRRVPSARPVQV